MALQFPIVNNALGLQNWRIALARQRTGGTAAKLAFYGSSTTYGLFQSAPLETRNYPYRVRSLMSASNLFGSVYEGEIWLTKYQAVAGGATNFDSRFTLGAGWVSDPNGYGAAQFAISNSADTSLLSFASGENCTGFTVTYIKNSTFGSFDWRVDGGSYTTVAAGGAGSSVATLVISGLSGAANHTVDIKFNTGSGTRVIISNIRIENSARPAGGILVTHCGINGSTSNLWASNSGHPGQSLPLMFSTTDPDLCIIQLGVNDANTNVTLANFYTNMLAIVVYAKALNCDVVLMIPHTPDEATLTGAGGFTQGTWNQYKGVIYKIGAEQNCPIIDMGLRWGTYANANTKGLMADTVHASDRGYWDMPEATFNLLLENK